MDEITAEVNRVEPEDLQRVAEGLLRTDHMALTLLGNLGEMKIARGDLAC